VSAAGRKGQRWRLDNAERRSRADPDTFFIPDRTRRQSLRPGDEVKLVFMLETSGEPGVEQVERMWVEVQSASEGRYTGRLMNEPVTPHELTSGAEVEFGPEHVAALAYDRAELGYDIDLMMFVSARVLERRTRPAELFYETPMDRRDSGWQAFAGDETQEYLNDPEHCSGIPTGWFAERHPEIEAALRDPKPGWWDWDEGEAAYVHRPRR
jgi:hypothetical protein